MYVYLVLMLFWCFRAPCFEGAILAGIACATALVTLPSWSCLEPRAGVGAVCLWVCDAREHDSNARLSPCCVQYDATVEAPDSSRLNRRGTCSLTAELYDSCNYFACCLVLSLLSSNVPVGPRNACCGHVVYGSVVPLEAAALVHG